MTAEASFQPSLLSQVSHELRIPLTGILGMAHFLGQTPLNLQQKEYLRIILESAQQLQKAEGKISALLKNHTAMGGSYVACAKENQKNPAC